MNETQTFELRGLQTAWIKEGDVDKPILLCLHGFPDDAKMWEYQSAYFNKDFQVICPYLRGVGPSEPGPNLQRYNLESCIIDIFQLLKKVDFRSERKIVILAHDIGAAIAWELAPLLGKRLASLVIINGTSLEQLLSRIDNPTQLLKSWYIFLLQTPKMADFLLTKFNKPLAKLAYRLGQLETNYQPNSEVDSNHSASFYRAWGKRWRSILNNKIEKVKCPTLVIASEKDKFLITPTEQEMSRLSQDHTVRIVSGNHWVHRNRHSYINNLISEFLQSKCHLKDYNLGAQKHNPSPY